MSKLTPHNSNYVAGGRLGGSRPAHRMHLMARQRPLPYDFTAAAALTAFGQAAPIQAWAKRGGQAIPARRLGHDQPEAKENGDQRHAEQQPQVHFKPLLFARDSAETAGIGVSRSFQ